MIKLEEKRITAIDYNTLSNSVGWGSRDIDILEEALDNTIYSVSVYDDERIIGYGRIIGDKTIFLYIQDVMVDKDYQGQRIGTKIMNALVSKANEYKAKYPGMRVYLGASKGKEEFYKKFNFITREEANLGDGMILK